MASVAVCPAEIKLIPGGPLSPFACVVDSSVSTLDMVLVDWQLVEYSPAASSSTASSLTCSGVVDPVDLTCSTEWEIVSVPAPFDPAQLDPQVVAALFGAGFLLYFTPWICAFGFSALLKMIRR